MLMGGERGGARLRFAPMLIAVAVMAAAACSGIEDSQDVASEDQVANDASTPAPTEPPATSASDASTPAPTEPPATSASDASTPAPTEPPATATPPTPQPTPAPEATATPEPLNVLTLADAKAGVVGVNWIATAVTNEEPTTFDANGVETTYFDTDQNGVAVPVFLRSPTVWGNPNRMLVLEGTPEDEFVQILVPTARPTGQTAWVRSDDVIFESSDFVIAMDVGQSTLEVWRNGEMVFFDQARERSQGAPPLVRNGVANWVESVDFERETFHPQLAAISIVVPCDDCDFLSQVSIRGEGEGFDRDAFFALLEANGQIDKGYSMWITREGLAKFMDLVPVGSRVEVVGGADDPFGSSG